MIEQVYREQYGRAVAILTRVVGSIDLAEDAVQEAFAAAATAWADGPPPSPVGWIVTTARNRAIDHLRREAARADKLAQAALLHAAAGPTEEGPVRDDRLRLIFTCCHPALNRPAQVALTLRLLGGLSTAEIARLFLVPEPTMAARVTRAKAKIRDARIPYRVPADADLPERLRSVLAVLYLVFTEGWHDRPALAGEAVRLARLLRELMPDEPEVAGLLALMLLTESRRPARSVEGRLVPLAGQDRSRWDRALIQEGQELVRGCVRRGRPGTYQLQAAIAAVHSAAPSVAATDWAAVLTLYDQLARHDPGPVVRLHRAVALAEVAGPAAALAEVEPLALESYHLFHAVRADLLERLGRDAGDAWERAIAGTDDPAERAHLRARRDARRGT
ncbi:MAG: RNA polymerase ECF-type sigma factor [uncultured Corynebacteriales bacterium]|uniref:RNA polymerase ECF-type sigma factor n=1 Tax=uncultured Mycobacteriales bacterium TaxID=581187 RepID=A0A6J4IVZ0_9ACTN|nr:MAG: RNA polymerase ECF-type sigma factor [uncultured Corynebacteriales bacterium]